MKKNTLQAFDDIFGTEGAEDVVVVSLDELYDFEITIEERGREVTFKHPFKVTIDERMMELAEDIKKNGVIQPALVIRRKEGGYTLIAGHRRKCGAGLAGLKEMPVRIKDLTPRQAIDYMYGSNLQRAEILPSERAKSYLMIYGSYKKQGSRTDLSKQSVGMKKFIEEEEGESIRTIYRYIALTNLIDPLLDMIDSKNLPITTAYELSFLLPKEQETLFKVMQDKKLVPSLEQAEQLHRLGKDKELDDIVIDILLERTVTVKKIALKPERINRYFPPAMSKKEREEVIYNLLEQWSQRQETETKEIPGQSSIEKWDDGKYMPG